MKLLYTFVFGFGAALAGLAGLMQAPISIVQIGMGENILILAFVVIIIGGIGSIRGAFVAAIIVGLIDTLGPRLSARRCCSRCSAPTPPNACAGAVVDVDLHADGGDPGIPAGRSVPGGEQSKPGANSSPLFSGFRLDPGATVAAALLALLALVPVYPR